MLCYSAVRMSYKKKNVPNTDSWWWWWLVSPKKKKKKSKKISCNMVVVRFVVSLDHSGGREGWCCGPAGADSVCKTVAVNIIFLWCGYGCGMTWWCCTAGGVPACCNMMVVNTWVCCGFVVCNCWYGRVWIYGGGGAMVAPV